jgi:hypothetical protein
MCTLFDRPVPLLSFLLAAAFLPVVLAGAARPAHAQTIEVRNGGTLTVENGGVWDLKGTTVDLGPAGSTARIAETGGGRFAGGTLTAVRALNSPSTADPAGLGIEISASVNLGDVTVTRGHVVQTASNGNASIKRYYEISPSVKNSGLNATLTHGYADAELNGLSESDLELFKSTDSGSTWSEEGVDTRDAQANTVTLSGIESFSRWTLGSQASPLPVELASFEATTAHAAGADEAAIELSWTTASEQNNAGFEVQRKAEGRPSGRSSSGGTWKQVGFRDSKAPGGTSTEAKTYRFTDEDLPYAADTIAYRLRQVDTDGSAQVTDPVRVARDGVSALELKETFPNPARSRVTVRFAIPEEAGAQGDVRLRLYDVLGREVQSVRTSAEAGRHETQFSVTDLASGVYILRLQARETSKTRRLTVVK